MTSPAPLSYETPGSEKAVSAFERPHGLTTALRIVTTIGIALWLGSLAHLLLSVASLFAAFPKLTSNTAVEAAPMIFRASERAGLIVAGVTLASAVLWNWTSPGRARRWLAWLLTAAAILAVVQTTVVSARMDVLREAGDSGGDAFRSLHAISSSQYLVQTAVLFACAALLPAALRDAHPRPASGL